MTEADWPRWTSDDLRPYIEEGAEMFGADRLMWGSDWPVCTLAAEYGDVLAVTKQILKETIGTDLSRVLGGCATDTYRLM